MWGKGDDYVAEKVTCTTEEERSKFEQDGYVVVSVAYFPENGKPIYTLERGSDWSEKLKNK